MIFVDTACKYTQSPVSNVTATILLHL